MHLAPGIGAQAVDLVENAPVGKRRSLLGAAVGPVGPRLSDPAGDLVVRGSHPKELAEIETALAVEAEEEGAVRGEPGTVAGAAERNRRRRDDAEGGAVLQPEALGRRPVVFAKRADGAVPARDGIEDLPLGDYPGHIPLRGSAHVHVLDEADLECALAGE